MRRKQHPNYRLDPPLGAPCPACGAVIVTTYLRAHEGICRALYPLKWADVDERAARKGEA